jgi:hypothetical protein
MELYEFPNEIPIATRWAGSACALILAVCVVCVRVVPRRTQKKCQTLDLKCMCRTLCLEFAVLISVGFVWAGLEIPSSNF